MLALVLTVATWCLVPPVQSSGDLASEHRVREFLDRSREKLYRADEAGLTQLSFRIPFELPRAMIESVLSQSGASMPSGPDDQVLFGELSVSWTAGMAPEIQFQHAEALPVVLQELVTQLEPEYQLRALTALNMALSHNVDVQPLLEDFNAKLTQLATGLDEVHFTPKSTDKPMPIRRLVWYFDSKGIPVKTLMESDQPTPSGVVTVTRTQTNSWRAATDNDQRLVLEWAHTLQDGGPLGTATSEITFDYGTFDGIILLTGFIETSESQEGGIVSEVRFRDIQASRER